MAVFGLSAASARAGCETGCLQPYRRQVRHLLAHVSPSGRPRAFPAAAEQPAPSSGHRCGYIGVSLPGRYSGSRCRKKSSPISVGSAPLPRHRRLRIPRPRHPRSRFVSRHQINPVRAAIPGGWYAGLDSSTAGNHIPLAADHGSLLLIIAVALRFGRGERRCDPSKRAVGHSELADSLCRNSGPLLEPHASLQSTSTRRGEDHPSRACSARIPGCTVWR